MLDLSGPSKYNLALLVAFIGDKETDGFVWCHGNPDFNIDIIL